MSELNLESFVTFKQAHRLDSIDFFPVPKKTKSTKGGLVVTLGDIPLPRGIPAPENALTVLYGFKDRLEELKRQYALARHSGMSLVKISFELSVGFVVVGSATLDDIPGTNFLNLGRLSNDVQSVILDAVNVLMGANVFQRLEDAGVRPDMICKAIRSDKRFAHITAVVYKIPDGGRYRQVATIFTSEVSNLRVRGDAPFSISLPKLATKKSQVTERSDRELALA